MKKILVFSVIAALMSYNGNNRSETDSAGKTPAEVHPPSETIPDSAKLVNDSVIVPDTVPGK